MTVARLPEHPTPMTRPADPATAARTSRPARRGWFWPLLVVSILAMSIGFHIVLIVAISGDESFAVERDWYRKAVDWDAHLAQQARNGELGWQVQARWLAPGDAEGAIELHLRDVQGRPVEGVSTELEVFHLARSGRVTTVHGVAQPDGAHRFALPGGAPGLHELRLRAQRGEDLFTWTERLDVR